MKTLEQILEEEKKTRQEEGMFGIKACKESILDRLETSKKYAIHSFTLFDLLQQYYERAVTEPLFNNAMVLACWELINERYFELKETYKR